MPSLEPLMLAKRDSDCPSGYIDYGYYCVTPWYAYGRWILLAAIIVGAFFIFCIFSCITARRRKRLGRQPFRGTGWAAGGGYGGQPGPYGGGPPPQGNYYNGPGGYQQQPGGWQQPPPQYGAPDGTHYGTKSGPGAGPEPYGGNPGSVELQSPSHAYQGQHGGDQVYAPPPGPPPGKDGVIR